MGVSFVGLGLMAVVAIVLLVIVGRSLSAILGFLKTVGSGKTTLTCPHCRKETSSGNGRCDACGQEL